MIINLLDLDEKNLTDFCGKIGEKSFRAKQLLRWIHQSGEDDFSKMSNLSKVLREKLSATVVVRAPQIISEHISVDGTHKWLMDVGAGNGIETVFIPESSRNTLCISSQVGCALDCTFCSTGRQGFNRNLSVAEIIGQLWQANRMLAETKKSRMKIKNCFCEIKKNSPLRHTKISNVVMMGMGEPLANFENVVSALGLMLDDNAYGLSRRRVTVSTSGLVPAMDRLRERCPVALAVSLHAPNDTLRNQLVPINRKYPLKELLAACQRYLKAAPRDFITFEYIMLAGINDSVMQASELVKLVKDTPCKFNLIPFNPFPASGYKCSTVEAIYQFQDVLMKEGLVTTVRKIRGDDIDAACGQLAGKVLDRTQRKGYAILETAR